MRSAQLLLDVNGLRVAEVRCRAHHAGWSGEEPVSRPAMVLVRSGLFRRRVDATESVVDTMTAYLQRPGSVQRIAHPCGGDICTLIEPTPAAIGELADRWRAFPDQPAVVSAGIDVDHRALLARARQGADEFELTERATTLVERLLRALGKELHRLALPPNSARGRWLADQVRQALGEDRDLGLIELAQRVGVSPYHLSRTFRNATGTTLTRYRRQLRLKAALEWIGAGYSDLARLAAEVGFADQAHLTRAMRAETGATPGRLRALLGPAGK
jgi:AraC-like DNA-binding protein